MSTVAQAPRFSPSERSRTQWVPAAIRGLRPLAFGVLLLHLVLLAASQWLIFDAFRLRTPDNLHETLASAFMANSVAVMVAESLALMIGGLVAVFLTASDVNARRGHTLTAWLMAHIPIALYSFGIVVAFLAGWELDVWVLSSGGATPTEIAATVREAIPVVLTPLSTGRHVANATAVVLFAVLQRRLSRTSVRRSIVIAAVVGVIMTLAQR